ncbi:MAG: ThiF family adenylyltransferase [Erythrobacter sp.]
MIWWTSQPNRARKERQAIAELEDRSVWLSNIAWRLTNDAKLCADFEIDRNGDAVPLTMTYPSFFPDMPPQVTPREEVRLSGHQYGVGGELCLEFRPDNWDPSWTGAMMIESAHRLLTGEAPASDEVAVVADAHRTTVGQDARNSNLRFVLPEDALAALANVSLLKIIDAQIVEQFSAGRWLAHLWQIGSDGEYWNAEGLIPKFRVRKGIFVRLGEALAGKVKADYDFVEAVVEVADRPDLCERLAGSTDELVLIVECLGTVKMMSLASGTGRRSVHDYRTVCAPANAQRLPEPYKRLSAISVAIVGCGSVGAKIAASLARSGVGNFVLVDGDVFFAGNIVRNELDWNSVGLNKPDAVKARLTDLNPSARVRSFRVGLGMQESSAFTDSALVAIGGCDVIVDATADPQVFNLCASVARNEKKTFVWGEVFAGGIGGLVVRLRPDHDPVPHAARRQIQQWCMDRGVEPPEGSAIQYDLDLTDGAPPQIAGDAEVTVIASHMARFVIDTLVRTETQFPASAYAIGLQSAWIFGEPFDTWPVALLPDGTWGPENDENIAEELDAFVRDFFPDLTDSDTK